MPTPIPPLRKTAFIVIVNAVDPIEAGRLVTILNNYEDVPTAIGRQEDVFNASPAYLNEVLTTLDNAVLLTVGIYFKRTPNALVVNPVLWINSITTFGISFTASAPGFGILGVSTIDSIILGAGVNINLLAISPQASVDIVDSTANNSYIERIYVQYAKSTGASLNVVRTNSHVGVVDVDSGAYFGGYSNVDPMAVCPNPVTGIAAREVTHNGVLISWAPPVAGYIFIDTYFRKTNSSMWIKATTDDGDFVGYTGFVFRHLDPDTYYDFNIVVTCNNGGRTASTVTTQTVCCGAGTQLMLLKPCPILISIVTIPSPDQQTLCNGATIPKEVAPGTTVTIPYFANKIILYPMVVTDGIVDDLTFNPALGEWDASGSTIREFRDGDTMRFNAALPA